MHACMPLCGAVIRRRASVADIDGVYTEVKEYINESVKDTTLASQFVQTVKQDWYRKKTDLCRCFRYTPHEAPSLTMATIAQSSAESDIGGVKVWMGGVRGNSADLAATVIARQAAQSAAKTSTAIERASREPCSDPWHVGRTITPKAIEVMESKAERTRFKYTVSQVGVSLRFEVRSEFKTRVRTTQPFEDAQRYPISARMGVPKIAVVELSVADDGRSARGTCTHWDCSSTGTPCVHLLELGGAVLKTEDFHPRWLKSVDADPVSAPPPHPYEGRLFNADHVMYDGRTLGAILAAARDSASSPAMSDFDGQGASTDASGEACAMSDCDGDGEFTLESDGEETRTESDGDDDHHGSALNTCMQIMASLSERVRDQPCLFLVLRSVTSL
jgi:hypothetical protein